LVPSGVLRYRIPVLPLVFVLAGVGAWNLGTAVAALLVGRTKTSGERVERSA
jgi:hypothetical protein